MGLQKTSSYLSIDMDYWFNQHDSKTSKDVAGSYNSFINKVISLNKSIFFCESHEQILKDLNEYKVDRLYNIDYHSDITIELRELEEGTWVNHYKYKDDCAFEWRLPSRYMCIVQGMGLCHSRFEDTFPRTKFPYKKSKNIQGLNNIDWSSIIAIGICKSPDWTSSGGKKEFDKIYNKIEGDLK